MKEHPKLKYKTAESIWQELSSPRKTKQKEMIQRCRLNRFFTKKRQQCDCMAPDMIASVSLEPAHKKTH